MNQNKKVSKLKNYEEWSSNIGVAAGALFPPVSIVLIYTMFKQDMVFVSIFVSILAILIITYVGTLLFSFLVYSFVRLVQFLKLLQLSREIRLDNEVQNYGFFDGIQNNLVGHFIGTLWPLKIPLYGSP